MSNVKQLNPEHEKALMKLCLERGIELQFGKCTVCNLKNHYHAAVNRDKIWQVHCDDKLYPFSQVYDDIWQAVNKFYDIKYRINVKR